MSLWEKFPFNGRGDDRSSQQLLLSRRFPRVLFTSSSLPPLLPGFTEFLKGHENNLSWIRGNSGSDPLPFFLALERSAASLGYESLPTSLLYPSINAGPPFFSYWSKGSLFEKESLSSSTSLPLSIYVLSLSFFLFLFFSHPVH